MSTTVALRRDGGVLHVTLNRPEARNALSLAMVVELREALAGAEADADNRIVVLRGAGGHFTAGADIKDMAGARMRLAADPDAVAKVNAAFGELCAAYASTGRAIVAVVEGTVMGGGVGQSAVFRLPEVSLGVVPAQIAPYLVERLGPGQAKRLAVTGGTIDAASALSLGLVHEVHRDEALDAATARVIKQILHGAPGAIAATKALMAKARLESPASLVQHAASVFSAAALGEEGTEGQTAFLAKRRARWMPE